MMARRDIWKRGVRALGLGAVLCVGLGPCTGAAALRERDWKQIFNQAQEQFDALREKTCQKVALDGRAPPENLEIAAASLRVASVFDFVVRAYPEKHDERAQHVAIFVDQAVTSYEKAFACVPTHEGRRTLDAAIALVHVALQDLESQPPPVREKYKPELEAHLARLEPQLPQGERKCPKPSKQSCEGPPDADRGKRCAIAANPPGGLLLLGLLLLLRRRRRSMLARHGFHTQLSRSGSVRWTRYSRNTR